MADDEERDTPFDGALVSAFWTYSRLTAAADRAERLNAVNWFWAWEAVNRATAIQVDGVVPLLVALADAVPGSFEDLAYLGAGPFENLLRHGNQPPSPEILDELDDAARQNENVRLAIRAVWWGQDDDPSTVARFKRFGPSY